MERGGKVQGDGGEGTGWQGWMVEAEGVVAGKERKPSKVLLGNSFPLLQAQPKPQNPSQVSFRE